MNLASFLIIVFVVMSVFSNGDGTGKSGSGDKDKNVKKTEEKRLTENYGTFSLNDESYKNLTGVRLKPAAGSTPNVLIYAGDDDLQIITSYIIGFYKRVPIEEAENIAKYVVSYSIQYRIDPKFITAVIARESQFCRTAVSPTDARGLGQIKPFNFSSLKISDPFDIEQSVQGCVKYVNLMLERWEGNNQQAVLALASYKEGYGAITRSGGKWSEQTSRYIGDILSIYHYLKNPHD